MFAAGVSTRAMSSLQSSGPAQDVSGPGVLEPQNHQFSNGRGYEEIPIAEPTEPTLSRGSPARRTLTISPREMVTIAK